MKCPSTMMVAGLFSVLTAVPAAAQAPAVAPMPASEFVYDRRVPFDVTVAKTDQRTGVTVQDVSYARLDGGRSRAYLVRPAGNGPHPGILFVHWLGEPSSTSNRSQFLEEAVELAAATGAVSFLPDALWSDPEWFEKRNPDDDYASSLRQVNEVRRALDLLASQPDVDPKHLLFVGHDFGAMYGSVAAGLDPSRLRAFVFMAGTRSFSDWFLLYPKVDAEARQRVIDRLAPLDPVRFLSRFGSLPVLFQFGSRDRYVSKSAADALTAAVTGPKDVRTYDAEHPLRSPDTIRGDRVAWITAHLEKRSPR